MESEVDAIPILKLKHILSEMFEKRETFILINFLKGCDTNKNGSVEKSEWIKFSSNFGIK